MSTSSGEAFNDWDKANDHALDAGIDFVADLRRFPGTLPRLILVGGVELEDLRGGEPERVMESQIAYFPRNPDAHNPHPRARRFITWLPAGTRSAWQFWALGTPDVETSVHRGYVDQLHIGPFGDEPDMTTRIAGDEPVAVANQGLYTRFDNTLSAEVATVSELLVEPQTNIHRLRRTVGLGVRMLHLAEGEGIYGQLPVPQFVQASGRHHAS